MLVPCKTKSDVLSSWRFRHRGRAFTGFSEVFLGKSEPLKGPITEVEQSGTRFSLPGDEVIAEREGTIDAKATAEGDTELIWDNSFCHTLTVVVTPCSELFLI
jgi:hypothetical protein